MYRKQRDAIKLCLSLVILCLKKGNRHCKQNVWRILIQKVKLYEDHLAQTEKESFLVFVANALSFFMCKSLKMTHNLSGRI